MTQFVKISRKCYGRINQGRIQDSKLGVAQMDCKIWNAGEGVLGVRYDTIIIVYISNTIFFKYVFLSKYCIS